MAQGFQVSLFDVHDPTRPNRLARYHLPGRSSSIVEYDPHAFLFEPTSGLLALPLDTGVVRLLTVAGRDITEIGTVKQPAPVSRSLLVDGELWTVSEAGLRVTDPATARSLGWLPVT